MGLGHTLTNECSTAPTLDASLYDPIADNLASGSGLVSSPTQLAAASHLVRGVAADNATQALVEITGAGVSAGDSIQLTLSDENGPSGNGASAGYLTALPANGMDSRTSNGVISIQAVSVPGKGTAFGFAAFHAPTDFVRALNSSDPGAIDRILTIKATDTTNNSTTTISVFVVRPPVVFVHGIWGSPRDFFASDGGVAAATSFTGWQVHYAQYNHFVALSSSVPAYPGAPLLIQGNSLGFLYGAGQVLPQIRSAITDYKPNNGGGVAIASTQVDVVAHSMGGDVVRFLPQLSGFAGQDTYNLGYVHKLISIDTPHLGSPLASSLLDPRNTCAAQVLAMAGKYAFNSANINGNVNVNGAVGDLQPTSAAIASMQSGAALIPTAMIGGQMTSTQTNGAGSAWEARVLVALCGNSYNNDPLAAELNPAGWTNLLSQYNDAIVSLASQFDNDLAYSVSTPGPGQNTFPAIHSPGANALGFLPPLIMDEASGAPAEVVNLLNTPVSNSAIFVVKP
jgi:triacylglycerol esterase/lipase EstA (alpha/beta hydrolase family)